MNILITGGAGYIGSVVAELLEQQGHRLVVVDDLRNGQRAAVAPTAAFHQVDLCDLPALRAVFARQPLEAVIHLAASANVPDSVVNPLAYYANNVTGTCNLLECMRAHAVKRIIFSSTAACYGDPQSLPIDEQHPLRPVNPYGQSKLMDEQILRDCRAAYGIEFVAFRYFCAAGATATHGESRESETHLIPVVLDQVLGRRDQVLVYGKDFPTADGTGVRDYIHVADIARAHVLALGRLETLAGEVFNLGTGTGYSVLEILAAAGRLLQAPVKFAYAPARPGDPPNLTAACAKAQRQLGWTAQFGLDDIIRSAYAWRKQPGY
jgi:UDP-glucose 4-epimerase